MQLFYDPELTAGPHELREAEARHVLRSLRKRPGDVLDLVDGRGGWFRGQITETGKHHCLLEVTETRREERRAGHHLTLAVAPTKNIDRLEWVLEKGTEIGVDRFHLLLTEHSERKRVRLDRLERVVEAAMKQSLRAFLPAITNLLPLPEVLNAPAGAGEQRFLAYLGEGGDNRSLHELCAPGGRVTVAIGPEGGFSPAEAELARDRGWQYARLGPHRLRTETAALVAVHTVEQLNWT